MRIYEDLARRVLFRLGSGDPEAAHAFVLRWLARSGPFLSRLPVYSPPGAARTVFGIRFPNAVGLAAGMDKSGTAISAWPALGFGFVEVGTVTPRPQAPNEGLRLARVPSHTAIINRMGFPNDGARAVAARLAVSTSRIPVGLSIGKGRETPIAAATEDYLECLRTLYPHGDYFVVNVSSPNTAGLTSLQDRFYLRDLLGAVKAEMSMLHRDSGRPSGRAKPCLVKVSPDLTDVALADLLEVCLDQQVDGLVATNTTTSWDAALHPINGGLSGAPLAQRVRHIVAFARQAAGNRLPVIGVGGITDASDGQRLLDAGASLVQLYTGFVYRGPGLVRELARTLGARLTVPGARGVEHHVGTPHTP
jgi:dihydroorotate dehydrogenase